MQDCENQAMTELRRILDGSLLRPVFQPIIDLRARAFLGFEALIRGPQGSCLEMPDALFGAARQAGLSLELEHAARAVNLRQFAEMRLPGRLFLNATPGALLDARMRGADLGELLDELSLPASRLVIELTENEKVTDLPEIYGALAEYRARGFQIAIDDLGEGFANLRMWSDLRPEFVKIDKHFIRGIGDDKIKYHFVRAMQDLAKICHAALIAEGVEDESDFMCIREMGIACAQGYFIARPALSPLRSPNPATMRALERERLPARPGQGMAGQLPTARNLLREIEAVDFEATNEQVMARFDRDPGLDVLPVVRGEQAVGMVNRHALFDRFARPYQKELFGKRGCSQFMDSAPLIVDQTATIQELAMMLALAPKQYLLDGFIITDNGRYLGVGRSHDLMALITEMQISAARYANPLTQLPGNVPINEHIDRLLAAGYPFVAAYIDIDNFKPYNDTFGYRRGDDVIQWLGRLVSEHVDPKADFVGHIGGDDFFVLFMSSDWEMRCWQMVRGFAEAMQGMGTAQEDAMDGYMAENRRGELTFQRLPTLSIGVVRVLPGECESHREVAAAAAVAKKQAKKRAKDPAGAGAGHVFVERRRVGQGELTATPAKMLAN